MPPVSAVHDRQILNVPWDSALKFLDGQEISLTAIHGSLVSEECESPLKRNKLTQSDEQGSLFE